MSRAPAWCFATMIVLACAARLFFGVDFTDEAYYLVVPLRFLMGDRPFVDELALNQSASLISLPFLALYHRSWGTEGIILFARFLYFALTALTALAVYLALQRRVGKTTALLLSLLTFAHIPINIPSLSYNTLGSRFFTLAAAMAFLATEEPNPRRSFGFLCGLFSGLAFLSYPTLGIPALSFLFWLRDRRRAYIAGITGPVLLFLGILAPSAVSFAEIRGYNAVAYGYGGGWDKFLGVVQFLLWGFHSRQLIALYFLFAAALATKPWPRVHSAVLLAVPLWLLLTNTSVSYPGSWTVLYFGVAGLVLFFVTSRGPLERRVLWIWCLPSIGASLLTAWSSSNGAPNASVAILPAAIAAGIFLSLTLRERLGGTRPAMALGVLVGGLVIAQFSARAIYCEKGIETLTWRISSGPFRGLWTTPEKAGFWAAIAEDIHAVERTGGRAMFYGFPAGHLATRMLPAVSTAWVREASNGKSFYARYYFEHYHRNNRAFLFKRLFDWEPVYTRQDPLFNLLQQTHDVVLARRDYVVLGPKP